MTIFSEPIKVSELMKKILKPHGGREEALGYVGKHTQSELEKILGIPQWKISNWKKGGDEDENNWRWALMLFTYCQEELGIDPRTQLEEESKRTPQNKTVDKEYDQEIKDIVSNLLERTEQTTLERIRAVYKNIDEERKRSKIRSGAAKSTRKHRSSNVPKHKKRAGSQAP